MKKSDEFELDEKYELPQPGNREIVKEKSKDHYTFYGKSGNFVDESEAFAKTITYDTVTHYFVWIWKGDLYESYGHEILRRGQDNNAKSVKVSRKVFESYLKYLKTKNRIYLTTARRLKMQG